VGARGEAAGPGREAGPARVRPGAVTGRLAPMRGRGTRAGGDVTDLGGHQLARPGLGYVPQVRDVFDTLTVVENLEMGLSAQAG